MRQRTTKSPAANGHAHLFVDTSKRHFDEFSDWFKLDGLEDYLEWLEHIDEIEEILPNKSLTSLLHKLACMVRDHKSA